MPKYPGAAADTLPIRCASLWHEINKDNNNNNSCRRKFGKMGKKLTPCEKFRHKVALEAKG